jgi:Caspase domain
MTKRALVIGVNDYSNWNSGVTVNGLTLSAPNLNFCVADANDFSDLLKDGFSFDEVDILKDSQATSTAIFDAIKRKLAASQAGDVMCLFFSGHGGRIPADPNSSTSRYYETIIPYDAAMISSMQIGSIVDSLEPSIVNFTIVLDSCHSGGMFLSPDARGFVTDQATIQTFVDNCDTIVPWIGIGDASPIQQNVGSIQMLSSGLCTLTVDTSKNTVDQAKATLFSACDYAELSGESGSIGHGYFTKGIIDTVNACNFQISHPEFLKAVAEKTGASSGGTQTPQLRGRPVRLQENFLAGWNYSV